MNTKTIIIHITQDNTYYTAKHETPSIIIDSVPTYLVHEYNKYSIPLEDRFIDYNKPNLFDYNQFKEDLNVETLNKNKTLNTLCVFIKGIIEKYVYKYEDPNINNIIICLEDDIVSKHRELLLNVLNIFKNNNMFSIEINKNNNLISNIYIVNENLGSCNKILSSLPSSYLEKFKYAINFNLCSDCLEIYVYEINGLNKKMINIQKFYTNNISCNNYKNRIIRYLLKEIEDLLPDVHNIQIEKIYHRFINELYVCSKCDITIEVDTDEEVHLIEIDNEYLNNELNEIFEDIKNYIEDTKNNLPKEKSFMFFTGKFFNVNQLHNKILDSLDYELVNCNEKSTTSIEGYYLLIQNNDVNRLLFNVYPNIKLINDISYEVLDAVDKINIRNKIEKIHSKISNIINIMIKMDKYKKDVPKLKQELKALTKLKNHGEMTNSTLNYMLGKLNEYERY